ncbi:MAG: YihA family ribosome biogenesis GTP-binding protein [Alphaproteobacteria bacterium]|nr:YihA family ribosome biogenesis GTP-binding protein [Alphaproteobacteria bacterium]
MSDAGEAARKLFAGPCDFVWGIQRVGDALPPAKLPEVAFVGRSNVGKSSLLNALTGRKTLARVSQTPGATRQINFFDLSHKLMLADLPGYGFAKVSKSEAAAWQEMIFDYLRGRSSLCRALLLIDARRGPGDSDRQVLTLLNQAAVSTLVVLTKLDEVAEKDRAAALTGTQDEARRHTVALEQIIATSAKNGHGIATLREHLFGLTAH